MLRRFGVTVLLPGAVLLLFGLRTLEQDRLTLDREILDRLNNAALLASRAIDQQLAAWQQFRGDGITLVGDPVKLAPAQLSAYEFADEAPAEHPFAGLAEAEWREFHGDLEKAADLYRHAMIENPRTRPEALLRLAETYAKAGKRDLAARTYAVLLRFPNERFGSRSTELIARFELCMLDRGDWPSFYRDLVAGRWRLDKARYLFYSEAARGRVPQSDPARAEEAGKLALSAAIERYLQGRRRLLDGYVAFWNEGESLIVHTEDLRRKLEQSVALDRELRIHLADEGAVRPSLSALHT